MFNLKKKTTIKWKRLDDSVSIPTKAHSSDAGMDMRVLVRESGDFVPTIPQCTRDSFVRPVFQTLYDPDLGIECRAVKLGPHESVVFHTGLKCAVPEGYYLEINPRSSLGFKKGIMLLNTTGVIDAHYRGEILIGLHNTTSFVQTIYDNERVVQCMLKKVEDTTSEEVEELDETDRGEGGFGSTGATK